MRHINSEESTSKDFHLEDAEKLHAEHPDTFLIPDRETRETVQVDCIVKLIFVLEQPKQGGPGAERMWVRVTDCRDGHYVGELDNDPFSLDGLVAGSVIAFSPEHIIDIYDEN